MQLREQLERLQNDINEEIARKKVLQSSITRSEEVCNLHAFILLNTSHYTHTMLKDFVGHWSKIVQPSTTFFSSDSPHSAQSPD